MKSRKLFPLKKRFSNGTYSIGFGKMAYYGLIKTLEQYHKALEVAEQEIEELKTKQSESKK